MEIVFRIYRIGDMASTQIVSHDSWTLQRSKNTTSNFYPSPVYKKPYSILPHSAPRSTRCLIIPNKNIPCKIFFPTISGFAYSPKRLTLLLSLLILSNSRMSICGPMPTGTILNPSFLTFSISFSACSCLCLKQTLWSVRKTRTQIDVGNNKLVFPGSGQLQTLDAAD